MSMGGKQQDCATVKQRLERNDENLLISSRSVLYLLSLLMVEAGSELLMQGCERMLRMNQWYLQSRQQVTTGISLMTLLLSKARCLLKNRRCYWGGKWYQMPQVTSKAQWPFEQLDNKVGGSFSMSIFLSWKESLCSHLITNGVRKYNFKSCKHCKQILI